MLNDMSSDSIILSQIINIGETSNPSFSFNEINLNFSETISPAAAFKQTDIEKSLSIP